jgi:hypothetical protein
MGSITAGHKGIGCYSVFDCFTNLLGWGVWTNETLVKSRSIIEDWWYIGQVPKGVWWRWKNGRELGGTVYDHEYRVIVLTDSSWVEARRWDW